MERKRKALILCAIIVVIVTLFAACQEKRIMWVGSNYPGNMEARYKYFNGTEDVTFNLKEGDTAAFTYDSKVDKGSLSIRIADPDNKTVMEFQSNQKGTEKIKAEKSGNYKAIITGSETSGSYDVKWKIEK